jgi:hypothetical protein
MQGSQYLTTRKNLTPEKFWRSTIGDVLARNATLSCDRSPQGQGFSTIGVGLCSDSDLQLTHREDAMDMRYVDPLRPVPPPTPEHWSYTILKELLVLGLILLSIVTGAFSWAFVEADLFM